MSVNKVILIGNLGKDPDVRRLNSGDQVVSFSVATSETWRDKASGARKERTEWHNVVIFNENLGKVAEQYCKKGSKVYLEGQLQTRKWQDQSGADRYTTEVVLQRFRGELQLLEFAWRRRRSRQLPRGRGPAQLGLQPCRDERASPGILRRRGPDRRRHPVLGFHPVSSPRTAIAGGVALTSRPHATFLREFYSGRPQHMRGFLNRSARPGIATFNAPHRFA